MTRGDATTSQTRGARGARERRRCDERQRRRRTRGGGVTRGDTTTSQSGQREGRNKRRRRDESRRRRRTGGVGETHLFCAFVSRQREKGGSGRMPTARNICVILRRSLGGVRVGCDILKGYYRLVWATLKTIASSAILDL